VKPWLAYLLALVWPPLAQAPVRRGRLYFGTQPWPGKGGGLKLPVMVWSCGRCEWVWVLEESHRWHRWTRYTEN
jgi:hypothetical protein